MTIKIGVPFTGLEDKLDIIATREDEAVAIACGIWLAHGEVEVFMQNSGYGHCLDIITSLCIPYKIWDIKCNIFNRSEPLHHYCMSIIFPDLQRILHETRRCYQRHLKRCKR